jgi:hypothetical protein
MIESITRLMTFVNYLLLLLQTYYGVYFIFGADAFLEEARRYLSTQPRRDLFQEG